MMMMLLCCSNLYAQNNIPKGEIIQDKQKISIDIEYIRLANQKLIERNYLIEANQYKDSIIVDYKKCIAEYEKIESKYKNTIKEYARINEDLNKSLNKQKKISLICGTSAVVSIATLVIISIIK